MQLSVYIAFVRSTSGKMTIIFASKILIETVIKMRNTVVNMYIDSSFSMFPPKPVIDKIVVIHLVKCAQVSIVIITTITK